MSRIEDYALIGDCETAALVARDGSIDWLCWPRFDSEACFAALLGDNRNGHWRVAPARDITAVRRAYRGDTLVLETVFETTDGVVALVDFMPVRDTTSDLVRIVEGRKGCVPMQLDLVLRFDYGRLVPWVTRGADGVWRAVSGPHAVQLQTGVDLRGHDFTTTAIFSVSEGERVPFALSYCESHRSHPGSIDTDAALQTTVEQWSEWASKCHHAGRWSAAVKRSLITIKAMTFRPTGGTVAAPTTSLPEHAGGNRNWDYRFCWIRDSTFMIASLLQAGYHDEALAWRDWLLRAVAGMPAQMQPLYGVAGEHRLPEAVLPWLPGFGGAAPVRTGNAAADQFQLDIYGELMSALRLARCAKLDWTGAGWALEKALLEHLEKVWPQPDDGIWEVRGGRQHFTHSKVMAWLAFDCAVKAVEEFGLDGPVDRWRTLRAAIHADVCRHGYSPKKGAFVQAYGSDLLDAATLLIPLVGFLPANDPRVLGTVRAIERELMTNGLVLRYDTRRTSDGLSPGEGVFLACTFWLVENYALQGRREDAERLFERLVALGNDVGLLAEEYDPRAATFLGNFPQALSHLALVNAAHRLTAAATAEASLNP